MNNLGTSESAFDQKLEHLKLADERWKMVRSAIEHEDNLVNRRLGWLFIGHGILFVCFAMLQQDVLDSSHKLESALAIEMGLAVLFLCAAFIAMATHRSNGTANNHISSLRQWWMDNGLAPETSNTIVAAQIGEKSNLASTSSSFPPSNYPPVGSAAGSRGSIPTLIALMDLVLLVVCLGISGQRYLDSKLSSSVPRVIESRSAREGNSRMDMSDQQSDMGASQESGASGGGEGGGGGARSTGAIDVP